ncbi:hypothetical protein NP493_424g02030 [Ridgeia piscesae]|uniref:Bursicon subunit alpha n=1 Tax=Ridgeia piscesae TaxID=27915 RepID=A0AAD9NVB2_RIDPI|nr:hypothetical protein NP493_424g02030 [Ridgeia piscesae]
MSCWVEACLLILTVSSVSSRDSCYTLEKEVYISRTRTYESPTGRSVLLTCAAMVPLQKCEGMCESQSQPSVSLFPRFKQVYLLLFTVSSVSSRESCYTLEKEVYISGTRIEGVCECKCCRESRLVDRHVTLDECYDGSELVPGQFIELTIKEPDGCRCFRCG